MAFIGKFTGGFLGNTAKPMVGTLYANRLPNSTKEVTINTDTQLVAGDPVVILVAQADKATGQIDGFNPDSSVVSAKATTTNTGSNSTACCGFLLVNSNDRVATGGVGLPVKGQRAEVAPLGEGAIVWLEVAEQNKTAFQTDLDSNTPLTIDATNGGVKVGSGTDIIAGAKLITGLTNAVKIKANGNVGELEDCFAVAVQLM